MATDATKGKKNTKKAEEPAPASPPADQSAPAPVAETSTPVVNAAETEVKRVPLSETLVLSELFTEDGQFKSRAVYRYNTVYGGAYAVRQAIMRKIAKASAEDILALPRRARNTMFALVKSELARYYGTAVRRQDNDETGTKAGEPLPQLKFNDKVQAASYGSSVRSAKANLIRIIFPKDAEGAAAETVDESALVTA